MEKAITPQDTMKKEVFKKTSYCPTCGGKVCAKCKQANCECGSEGK